METRSWQCYQQIVVEEYIQAPEASVGPLPMKYHRPMVSVRIIKGIDNTT